MHLSVIKEMGLRKFHMVEDKGIKVSSNGVGFKFVFCMTCYIDILNKIMKHKRCCTQCRKLPLLRGSGFWERCFINNLTPKCLTNIVTKQLN